MSLRPALRVVHRNVLAARSRDVTGEESTRSCVVLAPHPDDETIGCGATIARKVANGARVGVVVAADGGVRVRQDECVEACRRLGLRREQVQFLSFPDGGLGRCADALDEALRAVIERASIDEVLVPHSVDAHADHRVLAAAVHRVARDRADSLRVLAYPVWFWNRWAWIDPSMSRRTQKRQVVVRPLLATLSLRVRAVRTGGYLPHKRHALAAYETQVGTTPTDVREPLDPRWLELFFGPEELFFDVSEGTP